MSPTNTQVTAPAANGLAPRAACSGLRRRRGPFILVIGAIFAAAAIALALGEHWLAAADLVPLIFVLPCAAMMFMCMKGTHGRQTSAPPDSTQGGTSRSTDT